MVLTMSESESLAGLTRREMLQQLMDNISDNIYADACIVDCQVHTIAR